MHSMIIKPAIAAAVLLAVFLGIGYLDHSGVAWSQVTDHVQQARAFMFRLRTVQAHIETPDAEVEGQAQWTVYLSKQYGFRMDIEGEGPQGGTGMVSWYVPAEQDSLTMVIPQEKQWMQLPYSPEQAERDARQNQDKDPALYIQQFMAHGYRELGQKEMDGHVVEGIEVQDPPTSGELEQAVGRLWVDVDTELPLLIEIEGIAGTRRVQWIMDFRWDDAVDPAVFEPDLGGYTLVP